MPVEGATVRSDAAGGKRRAKATTSHFWHFNIETEMVTTAKQKKIIKKTNIELSLPPNLTLHLSPVSPQAPLT